MTTNIVKYSLLSFPIASFGLGVWQIKRLEWKKALIARLEQRLKDEPLNLLDIESAKQLDTFEYRRIKTKGRYDRDPNHQLYLKPRALVANQEALLRGRTAHQSNIGANIVTPFLVDGTNLRILVNRGWLATKGADSVENSANLGLGPENGTVDLEGILRISDKRPRYGLKNNVSTNEWQIRDVEAMSKVFKTAPIFIDAVQNTSATEGPIGGQTQLNVRNEHLNYAITWFSLAVFSYIMWFAKYGKRNQVFSKFVK